MFFALLVYNLIVLVTAPIWWPVFLFTRLRRGHPAFGGGPTRADGRALAGRQVIWLHGASLGESKVAAALYRKMAPLLPEYTWVATAFTRTGFENLAKELPQVEFQRFFPLDLPWSMWLAVRRLRPRMLILVETELWPNLLAIAAGAGVKLATVNGRLSEGSARGYKRLGFLFAPCLRRFSLFLMRTPLDAERVIAAGAPETRVLVSGNLKFDLEAKPARALDRSGLGLADGPMLVGGSTHAGEEEELLEALARIRQAGPAVLAIAPRHLERLPALKDLLARSGRPWGLRSEPPPPGAAPREVLLVDTYGELMAFYDLAAAVFIGGSLVPIGGHNPLEASVLGRPAMFGPYLESFREAGDLLLEAGAAREVKNAAEIASLFLELAAHPEQALAMGECGRAVIAQNRGAAERSAQELARLLCQ